MGTFFFKKPEARTFVISNNYRIRLTKISPLSASLQLVDEHNEIMNFPAGFHVRDTLYNEDLLQVAGMYVVSWMSNYTISVNDVVMAKIYNQRQFAIFKAKENVVGEYDAEELADESA